MPVIGYISINKCTCTVLRGIGPSLFLREIISRCVKINTPPNMFTKVLLQMDEDRVLRADIINNPFSLKETSVRDENWLRFEY